jgi:Transposase DDE domain group 1
VTNLPERTPGWRGQLAYIDTAHRVHARVEDCVRTGKDTGIGRFPSLAFALNQAWLAAALIAAALLAWLRQDGDLAKAEPKHCATAFCTPPPASRSGRRRRLKIAATWPWATAIEAAWNRITALAQGP